MTRALASFVAAAVLAAVGLTAGWFLRGDKEPRTLSYTQIVATTVPAASALPAAVERTRAAVERAAAARDFAALTALVPATGFSYTFGEPVPEGAVAYWRDIESTSGAKPFETLAKVLSLPYSLRQGLYVWPFAYGTPKGELTDYERGLLGDLVDAYAGEDYYGWRAGIKPDGSWAFFIAGD